jgi:serine/threonine-protein kinase
LLALAAECADDGLAAEDGPSLCCGRAGEGFAALTLFRATGDNRWVIGAERALADAVRSLEDYEQAPQRLFSGALGVALLACELEDPGRAAMPVFEAA